MNARQLLTQLAREKGVPDKVIIGGHLDATEKMEKTELAEETMDEELTAEQEKTYRRVFEILWENRGIL